MKYVYVIDPEGQVEGLLKDAVFDTRKLGMRSIKRISDIEHINDTQCFVVKWLLGPYAGHYDTDPQGNLQTFATYERAVEHEVARVNEMRRQGVSFS